METADGADFATDFVDALFANPAPGLADELYAFEQFTGSWDVVAEFIEDDGTVYETSAEWHFAPILGGRAIQDVLMFPAREEGLEWDGRMGTTVRILDLVQETWRIVWFSPAGSTVFRLSGGPEGDRIVMRGDPGQGDETVWTFHSVTDKSFEWEGSVSADGGATWRLVQRMSASRR